MTARWTLGPVFDAECLAASRRWQFYAGRALLVSSVLAGLVLVWLVKLHGRSFSSHEELASVGSTFSQTILAIELVLALVLVPAATAGAICQDKMRGNLALLMVTKLSDSEIVLGRFAARLTAVLGIVACGLPVLALSTTLGGVDPRGIVQGTLVVVGVAILGVAVALTYSVWATRPHEALMATYATWAVWLLALLAWSETTKRGTPGILYVTNPFWVIFGRTWFTGFGNASFLEPIVFLVICLVVSSVLATTATVQIRKVTLRQSSRSATEGGRPSRFRVRFLPRIAPSLDAHPILWREWHRRRPSSWGRAIWRLYAILSALFVVLSVTVNPDIGAGSGGFMVSIGLLMVSVTSATSLAEERAHGSLDVLMTTPLPSRAIVLGKWWGAFRVVPSLAWPPALLALGLALRTGHVLKAIPLVLLVCAIVLAYGAVVTSLGLALATWQPRLGRAVALSVAVYLTVTVVLPTVVLFADRGGPYGMGGLFFSPFFGVFGPLSTCTWRGAFFLDNDFGAMLFWTVVLAVLALLLLKATQAHFDRLTGRVPESGERKLTSRRLAASHAEPALSIDRD